MGVESPVIVALIGVGTGMIVSIAVMMIFTVMVAVVVRFEGAALTELELGQAGRLVELGDDGIRPDRLQRLLQKRFEPGPDPEHHLGVLQGARVRRLHIIGMGRGSAVDDQFRRADALHDR